MLFDFFFVFAALVFVIKGLGLAFIVLLVFILLTVQCADYVYYFFFLWGEPRRNGNMMEWERFTVLAFACRGRLG